MFTQKLSVGLAVLLIVAYGLGMVFSLKTHKELFASAEHGEEGEAPWPMGLALATLAGVTVLVALVSEVFVESVQKAAESFGMTPAFVGFIVVALVGGAAEMASAFSGARKNRLDMSVGIALGSASQIALFVAPVLVLLSYVLGPAPMDLQILAGRRRDDPHRDADGGPRHEQRSVCVVRRGAAPHGLPDLRHDALPVAAPGRMTGGNSVADAPFGTSKRLLEPVDRASEILFGLIMVLAITGSFSVAGAGRAEVRTMLIAALGCNLAWGVIDAVFYLMGCLAEAAHKIRVWDAVRKSDDPEEGRRAFAGALPAVVASALQPAELETMRVRLQALPEPPDRRLLRRDDWLGATGVFLLVFLSTFPVVIPFIFMKDVKLALRISDGIAILLLFVTGYSFGRHIGRHTVWTGIAMVFIGAALVALTIALGG